MGVLIGLLATTGLRPGEAFALGGEDVDLEDGVLVVRDSKFHKSRQVPLHTVMALHAYRKRRDRWFSTSPSAPFIACRPQGRLADKNVHYAFHQLLNQTGVDDPKRRRPRLHDFRHTFGVKTLREWHARGLDVQSMLPLLSSLASVSGKKGVEPTNSLLIVDPIDPVNDLGRCFELCCEAPLDHEDGIAPSKPGSNCMTWTQR